MKNNIKFDKVIILFFVLSSLIFGQVASANIGVGYFKQNQKQQMSEDVKGVQTVSVVVVREDVVNPIHNESISGFSASRGSFINAFNGKFKIVFPKNVLKGTTDIEVLQIMEPMETPWNLKQVSGIYQFDFKNKEVYTNGDSFEIKIGYDEFNNDYKQVYYYDNSNGSWKVLPTTDYPQERYVSALIQLSFARVAVFANIGVMTKGSASWYAYKDCDCAASPDFPKGSRIRVTAVNSGKTVDVIINDWGPERDKFPDRVIDLDKLAFAKLAPIGAGIIDVEIEPLYIAPDSRGRILGVKVSGAKSEPIVAAKSAIIMNEAGGIVYNKNIDEQLPLASLTKIVAVKTFLDTKPSLFKKVEYKYQDEKYNHLYCKPWESARVRLKDGDLVTVRDLVYSSLVGSANNAVESLVRLSGMTREKFVERMNQNVKSWGTTSTHFIEPTGLSTENVSSVRDYAIITKEVLKDRMLAEISITPKYSFTTINTKEAHNLRNTNWLVRNNVNNFNIVGSKTGYLIEAKHCLMVQVDSGSDSYTFVSFGAQNKNDSFEDMKNLINFALNKSK